MNKNDLKFYEKLIILLVTFVIVVVVTGGIFGQYAKTKKEASEKKSPNRVILETIHLS